MIFDIRKDNIVEFARAFEQNFGIDHNEGQAYRTLFLTVKQILLDEAKKKWKTLAK